MKIKMREDLEDVNIPSYNLPNTYYSVEQIDNAEFISDDEDSGEVLARLKDDRVVSLYSIDLDFIR